MVYPRGPPWRTKGTLRVREKISSANSNEKQPDKLAERVGFEPLSLIENKQVIDFATLTIRRIPQNPVFHTRISHAAALMMFWLCSANDPILIDTRRFRQLSVNAGRLGRIYFLRPRFETAEGIDGEAEQPPLRRPLNHSSRRSGSCRNKARPDLSRLPVPTGDGEFHLWGHTVRLNLRLIKEA